MKKELIKVNDGFVSKIKNFFRNLFYSSKKSENIGLANEKKENNIAQNIVSKDEFMSIYQKAKNKEIDLETLEPKMLEKMCILLEEEISLKQKKLDEKLLKIKMYG